MENNENRFNQHGIVLVLTAVGLFAFIAFVSLAVEISLGRAHQRHLQAGADAAALAGTLELAKNPVLSLPAQQEAGNAATANILTNSEVTAIEVGTWDFTSKQFSPSVPPYTAIRVAARRTVPVIFSQLLSWSALTPAVESVAVVTNPSEATCVIPYGIGYNFLSDLISNGLNYGDVITVEGESSGNWGKLDIGGNMSSLPDFTEAMVNGACTSPLSIGEMIEQATGYAGVPIGFEDRIDLNPIVVIPVVTLYPLNVYGSDFDDGNGNVQVMGFIVAELIEQSGHQGNNNNDNNGNDNNNQGNGHGQGGVASDNPGGGTGNGANWSGQIRILREFAGYGGGGPANGLNPLSRVLVK